MRALKFTWFLLFHLSTISFSACTESPSPEVLLQPRNFNPHPYLEGGRILRAQTLDQLQSFPVNSNLRTGPVLFPPNPEDSPANNAIDVAQHPYPIVAKKQKNKLQGRFPIDDQENNINPQVYSGLANYAAKVLKKPSSTVQNNGFHDTSLSEEKKNYKFSYTVQDESTGDDFSHSQSQNSRSTNGEYRVKLPDGRVQIVSYIADNNGYKADVKYSEDNFAEYQGQAAQPDYDYYEEGGHQRQVSQIDVPIYDDNSYNPQDLKYEPEYIKIYPQKITPQYEIEDKLVFYPADHQNIDYNENSPNKIENDEQKPIEVLISDSPQQYSQVYITTPKYSISQRNSHSSNIYYKR